MALCMLLLLLCVAALSFCSGKVPKPKEGHDQFLSPYNQNLPNCKQGFTKIRKKTKEKAILCPMFKDEMGFLNEWIAYYKLQGFDHIMMFDDDSSDDYASEIAPWVKSGFVSVKANWTTESLNMHPNFARNEFKRAMTSKQLLERSCKLKAIEWGYKYFVSLDIDEYLIPSPGRPEDETLVDELDSWFSLSKGHHMICIQKLNFQSTPHILEPVNLLTIEAYQTRMRQPRRMNFYTTVAPKCAFMFNSVNSNNNTAEFIATCCHFHGCHGHDIVQGSTFCKDNIKEQTLILNGGKYIGEHMSINHYSRSLEKFGEKAKTWTTSGGEVKENENMKDVAKNYDLNKFLQRSVGWKYDGNALRFSCQVREVLQEVTGEKVFFRAGTQWYRNAEFGLHVSEPDKRGRYGRPNPEGFHFTDGNPYLYQGEATDGIKGDRLAKQKK